MNIFAKLDAETIPSNPFHVKEGEYSAEVTQGKFQVNKDEKKQLVIEYTINSNSDGSDTIYQDKKLKHIYTLPDADLDEEKLALLPVEEQKRIMQVISSMKKTLCGSGGRNKGLGVNPSDLNDEDWNPETLVGTKVVIGVRNYGEDNNGVSVQWVNLEDAN